MYDAAKIAERLDQAEKLIGWRPVYHSVDEVDMVTKRLDQIAVKDSSGNPTGETERPFTEDEKWWIRNERMLCMCDADYFCTRYAYVKDEKNNIKRFSFRTPQKVYFDVIAELEKRGAAIQIQICKARQLGMCLDPETKVLTSDLRWVRIDDLVAGDEIIGIDEGETEEKKRAYFAAYMRAKRAGTKWVGPDKKAEYRKMRNTTVIAKRTVFEKAFRIVMEDGRVLIATAEHRFLMKERGGKQPEWRRIGQAREGDSIRYVTKPWDDSSYEDGWFGGLMDGEGSLGGVTAKGSLTAQVCQVDGRVLDRAKQYLNDRDYNHRIECDIRKGEDPRVSKYGNRPVYKLCLGRMNEIFRLFGQCRPSRWGKVDWWVGRDMPGKKTGQAYSKIVAIEPLPAQRMIDIETSTKTFIAEGFVSHNSTLTELLVAHRIFFTYGVNAVIASADQQKTGIMSQMIFLVYDKLPYWMKPPFTRRVESDKGMLVFGGIQSGVSFQHGAQTSGIARGTTPTCVHLSEVASYQNAEETIESSLFRAVHESPGVFMVLESTAEGNFGWWFETWKKSKTGWSKGRARLYPLFLPWFMGTDLYPTETWIHTRPIPHDWSPMKETRAMMAKAKMYVNTDPILSKVMGEGWELPREQAWYWEVNFDEHKAKGAEKKWYQEMPTDSIECFQGSFDSVFGNDLLDELHESRTRDYKIYGITGHGIEDKNEPAEDDIDFSDEARHKIVTYQSNKGDTYKWELVPLRPDVIDDEDEEHGADQADGKLLIFNEPEPGHDYTVGVDTGGGVGGDSTSIEVWRKGVRGLPDVQCAEFASAFISHVEAYAYVMAIAAYYAKFMRNEDYESPYREPLVSVEQIAAVGDTCQSQMKIMGYNRFFLFHQYDTRKIQKKKATKMGWRTSGWSRPLLVDGFVHSVKNEWATIHSPFLLREMSKFEVHIKSGKEKMEHADGDHDDRIFSSAIAIFTSHDMEAMVERGKNKPIPMGVKHRPIIDLAPIGSFTMRTDSYSIANSTIPMKTTQDLEDYIAQERLSY